MCGIVAMFSARGRSRPTPCSGRRSGSPPRSGRAADVGLRRAGRAGPCATEHHRSGDRRSADRQRGRPAADRRQRRVLRLRAHPRASSKRQGHAFAPDPTARSRCISMRISAPPALHALRGEFAFAIWDERDGQLFAARDRFGIKPLYYADARWHGLSGVRGQGAVRGRRARCAGTARRSSTTPSSSRIRPDRTLFDGIYQVPPGHYLLADRRAASALIRYWDWDYPAGRRRPADRRPTRVGRALPSTSLEEAVRLRLRADVPVGCYLSGGIDSCAVLGFAARHRARAAPRLHALVRPRRLRRGAHRPRDGGARRRRVLPDPDPRRPTWPITSPTRSITPRRRASTRTASPSTC